MNRISLQALTWGTVATAVASAMLLAAASDDEGRGSSEGSAGAPGRGERAGGGTASVPGIAMPAPLPSGDQRGGAGRP
ncbi:MAG TPA: hypothetical protein VJM48_06940 [Methylibium sp.]|nr:hypothetical protein [Methylibium sp.]